MSSKELFDTRARDVNIYVSRKFLFIKKVFIEVPLPPPNKKLHLLHVTNIIIKNIHY